MAIKYMSIGLATMYDFRIFKGQFAVRWPLRACSVRHYMMKMKKRGYPFSSNFPNNIGLKPQLTIFFNKKLELSRAPTHSKVMFLPCHVNNSMGVA